VPAKELISHFDSHIVISEKGQITVTETIDVVAENYYINRGIYRDFPTQYFGAFLTKKEVGFEVITITRNGQEEPFHTEQLSNGIRIYIGSSSVLLSQGPHQYQITYQTDNQLGYFAEYDELYWNVTGTGWELPIVKASATVMLPNGAREQILNQQAWTGYQGQKNTDYTINNSAEALGFETSKELSPYQGITIGIQVPKGIFAPPPFDLNAFLAANILWVFAIIVCLFYLGFYFSAWYRHGRDPDKGVIVARFHPPQNLSPAAVHFIDNEIPNDKTLTAGLLSLAVKGHITITQLKKSYRIRKLETKKMSILSKGERAIKANLFKGKKTQITLSKSPNTNLRNAKNKLRSVLQDEYKKKCFLDNRFYVIWGWVISLICFFCGTLLIYSNTLSAFDLFFLLFAGSVFLTIAAAFFLVLPLFMGILLALIVAFNYLHFWQLLIDHQVWVLFTLFLLGTNLLFGYLLRAPTPFGRHIKDQIDGLKLYMKSAEEHRLDMMNPPEKTIDHYESLLPYAVALSLENQWAEKFSELINTEQVASSGAVNSSYQPSWYQNDFNKSGGFNFSTAAVSQSLRRSVAASSQSPKTTSSSYSSGSSSSSSSSYSSSSSSGSSGGGGGGGGGGGW
jgi:uncharacterized membrane protein YgcG